MFRAIPPPARRSVQRILRVLSALLAAAIVALSSGVAVLAATDASDVVIDVFDAVSGAPISLARVLLQGEVGLIGYTDPDGHARFESVATGSYRAMVVKNGVASVQAGAGLVADSVPQNEYQETVNKARALIAALEIAHRGGREKRATPRLNKMHGANKTGAQKKPGAKKKPSAKKMSHR